MGLGGLTPAQKLKRAAPRKFYPKARLKTGGLPLDKRSRVMNYNGGNTTGFAYPSGLNRLPRLRSERS